MPIPTTRTKEKGLIAINSELCTGCGLCVKVCADFSLEIINGKVAEAPHPAFGCVGCGHCMAICPTGAITISRREISPDDLIELPSHAEPDWPAMHNFLLRRRSIREFKDEPVSREIIDKILESASTAPMGLPPSDVHVLVLDSKEKVRQFSIDFCNFLESMKWFVSGWFLTLMRPFWGKANDEMFRGFIRPLFDIYIEKMKQGKNVVTYDAPLAIYFYGSPYCDPADPLIAATYAMLAGESLGLGSCMLGGIHPMIQHGKKAVALRKKYGIKYTSREGLVIVFGYPKLKYNKGIRRTFAGVDFY